MASMFLDWKEFTVNLEKVRASLKSSLSSNYDGLVCDESGLMVMFFTEPSSEDQDATTSYWNGLTANSFNPTLTEIIDNKINEATNFGLELIKSAANENIQLGITQVNKTRQVSNYFERLQTYLRSGSLYAAIAEIDDLITAGIPGDLAPFVTEARLLVYRGKITTFLS